MIVKNIKIFEYSNLGVAIIDLKLIRKITKKKHIYQVNKLKLIFSFLKKKS